MWFTQAEAQFALGGISSEIKFCHMISHLDYRYVTKISQGLQNIIQK
jgi:hypothetical protein